MLTLIKVFDKSKTFGSRIWSYLYDFVPVDTMLEDGYDCCTNWISEVPQERVRTVEDNEEYYKDELEDLGYQRRR